MDRNHLPRILIAATHPAKKRIFSLAFIIFAIFLFSVTVAEAGRISGDPTFKLKYPEINIELAKNAKLRSSIASSPSRLPYRQVQEGDTAAFWTYNWRTGLYELLPATCRKVGGHCYVFVDDVQWGIKVNATHVNQIAAEFDNNIYPTCNAWFGQEWNPGIDNDPHIYILVMDIQDNYAYTGDYIAGYFNQLDELPDSVAQAPPYLGRSNQKEIFFMDCNPVQAASAEFFRTLAHEFHHMIQFNQNAQMPVWVDEGLSDFSEVICGYGIPDDHIRAFEENPYDNLISFDNKLADYGSSFTFIYYFIMEYGGTQTVERQTFTRLICKSRGTASTIIDAVLASAGYPGEKFKDVFGKWAIANYFDYMNIAHFSYQDFNITIPYLYMHSGYPVRERSWDIPYWSANHILFKPGLGDNKVLRVQTGETGHLQLKMVTVNKDDTVTVYNIELDGNKRAFFDMFELGTKYNFAVLIPYLPAETGSQKYRYDVGFAGPKVGIYPNPILPDDIHISVRSKIKPTVLVHRSGGVQDETVRMVYASPGVYNGMYHVSLEGEYTVQVYGQDESELQGTVTKSFKITKIYSRIQTVTNSPDFRARLLIPEGGAANDGKIMLMPARDEEGELVILDGLTIADRGCGLSKCFIEFVSPRELPEGVTLSRLGILKINNPETSSQKASSSAGNSSSSLLSKAALFASENRWTGVWRESNGALKGEINGPGEYLLVADMKGPEISRIDGAPGSGLLKLVVLDDASGVEKDGIKVEAGSKLINFEFRDGVLTVNTDDIPGEYCRVNITDRAGNTTSRLFTKILAPGTRFAFIGASPNPAKGPVTLMWKMAAGGAATFELEISDLAGNRIFSESTIVTQDANGYYFYVWPLVNQNGKEVANGVYYFTVRSSNGTWERSKICVLR